MMTPLKWVILIIGIFILATAIFIFLKPKHYIGGQRADTLKSGDEAVFFGNKIFFLRQSSEIESETPNYAGVPTETIEYEEPMIQLIFEDKDGNPAPIVVSPETMIPIKTYLNIFQFSIPKNIPEPDKNIRTPSILPSP